MNNDIQFLLSLSISITLIIGVIRYKLIDSSYYPFFYLAGISLLAEVGNYFFTKNKIYPFVTATINIFCLIEFIFYTWLFHLWGLFNFKLKIIMAIVVSYFMVWIVLVLFAGTVFKPLFYFRILYSLTLIFFAVTTFNKFVIQERAAIFKNPKFWIVAGIIIFFSFYLLIQSANLSLFGATTSKVFRRGLTGVVSYSNLIVNLIFAIGALCIPRKKNFTKLF